MNLPAYAVKHPVTTLMSFLAIVMVGAFCLFQFPVDMMPDMDIPALTVMTVYEGAAPEDVETKVTKVLEDTLSAIPDLKHITSVSSEGLSKITLSFEWQTDLDTRANDARDAIDKAKMFLPDDIDPPRVLKFNMADFPILIFGVRAKESYPRLKEILEDNITDPIKRLPGVALAAVITPIERQINVHADRERLAGYALTLKDLVAAIGAENLDVPAGNVKTGDTDYLVRVPGEFKDVEPMKNIVVAVRNGKVIRLADVAEVEDSFKEIAQYVSVDGESGAAIVVRKQSGANTVQVANAVKKEIARLSTRLPRDVSLVTVMDSSEDIERMIGDLTTTLWQGAALAMLVVLVFLRRWRATLIIALAIPFSLLLALVAMFFLKYTINMMTLFGLIIAVGMVVDNGIVILENITRHREEGELPEEGAIYGATEVGLAVAASTLTTVCIFFPILFVKGITKIFFSQFAVVASIALLGSLFSSLTLTPMLASVLLRAERFIGASSNPFFIASEKIFLKMEAAYSAALGWALSRKKAVVGAAMLIFVSSLLMVPRLGSEFMPKEDRNSIRGTIYMPVGTRVEKTARTMSRIDQIMREEIKPSEYVARFTRCGTSGGMGAVMQNEGSHIGSFSVRLTKPENRKRSDQEIAAALRRRIAELKSELDIDKFTVETTDMMSGMILGGERPLTVNILGDDLDATDRLAAEIQKIALSTPGAIDVSVSREKARPEIQIALDRARASQMGLNVYSVGDAARASFYGAEAGKYRIHGDEYDIFVRFREEDRNEPQDVADLPLRLPSGQIVRANNVAEIRRELGPVQIDRKDQTRVVNVTGDVYGRALGAVTEDIKKQVARLQVPPGVDIVMAGQSEEMRESFFWLTLSIIIGTILVYMVMAAQFESLLNPFVVMFSVPFALTGVIWGLWAGGYHINVIVFLGLLLLIGTVVNNAIVLVDYIGILRARGLSMVEAVRRAGATRLRPVLMTALTTIVALIPMAFKKGQGAEVWNPLGMTVIAGLTVSTFVTLILVPTIYSIFESRIRRTRRVQEAESGT